MLFTRKVRPNTTSSNISLVLSLALLLTGVGLIPLIGQAAASGITSGKYGAQQVFDVQRPADVFPTCSVGETTAFNSFTVSGATTPFSGATGGQVSLSDGRYIMFFDNGNETLPWGIKLFDSSNNELRLNAGQWITESQATAASIDFATLPVFTSGGQLYGLGTEGFFHNASPGGWGTFISNGGPLAIGGGITYTPIADLNDCIDGLAIANKAKAISDYNANTTPNATLDTNPNPDPSPSPSSSVSPHSNLPESSGDLSLISSLGIMGVDQGIKPLELKATGSGTYTFAIDDFDPSKTLPSGLTLDSATGILSGTPSSSGTFTFDVIVSDNGVPVIKKTYTVEIFESIILNNGALRFGGTYNHYKHSINSRGLLEQPFYRSTDNQFYKLTFSNYPLDMAIGTGTGSSHWAGNTVQDLSTYGYSGSNQIIDYSGLVESSISGGTLTGYGVISVSTEFEVNSQKLEVTHKYTLAEGASFVKIQTDVRNLDSQNVRNGHIWVGTRDDYVGNNDQPVKTRGTLDTTSGSFVPVSSRANIASALKITTDSEGALFYSTTAGTDIVVNTCCGFQYVYNLDPRQVEATNDGVLDDYAADLTVGFDGSYATVLPFGELESNQKTSITWYYAAGAIADLDRVARDVAGAASGAPSATRSGTDVTISWSASEPSAGNVVTGYQYRYYYQLDGNGDPVWVVSNVLPSSARSATISNLPSNRDYYFQIRAITEPIGGGSSTNGDWSGSGALPGLPGWEPTSTTFTGRVGTAFTGAINTSSATGLNLSSGLTVAIGTLPAGVTATVTGERTQGEFPLVTFSGTPSAPGSFTVTVTITDSNNAQVSVDFTFVISNRQVAPIDGVTPVTPTPTPSPSQTPTPTPTRTSSPTPSSSSTPTPTPSPTPTLGPVVLIPEVEPTTNVVYNSENPIPQELVDVLSRPLAYLLSALTGSPQLPELAPKDSLAYENGEPIAIELIPTDSKGGYILRGDGWEVQLEATDSTGAPLKLDESGNIILNDDRYVQFSGDGFAPGSLIKVWLFSDPAELATVTADSSGSFTGKVQLPGSIPNGEHTLQLNGLTKDGQVRSVALGVLVQPILVSAIAAPDFGGLIFGLSIFAGILGAFLIFFALRRRRRKNQGQVTPSDSNSLGELFPRTS